MTPLAAVAAAIRERLLEGEPAPLPGLGTLVRRHVPARVEERADGTRVMLPPGETIGLDPNATGAPSLAVPFARFSALSQDVAERAYANAMDQVEALLSATGEVRLPGVGLLRRTSTGVVLGVEAELLAAVNRTYEGLSPVPTRVAEPPAPATPLPSVSLPQDRPPAPQPAPSPAEPPAQPPPPAPVEPPAPAEPPAQAPPIRSVESPTPTPPPPTATPPPPEPSLPASEPRVSPPVEPAAPRPADLDGPLRDLSFDDDAFGSDPDLPSEWQPPIIEVVSPSDMDDAFAPPPTAPTPTAPPDDDPETDTPLAAPFGGLGGPSPSDVLPPTPPDRDPTFSPPDAEPAPEDDWTDDWASETWTAPAFGARSPLDDPIDPTESDVLDSLIEDADFDVLETRDPEPSPQAPPPVSDVPPPPPSPDPTPEYTFPTFDPPLAFERSVPDAAAPEPAPVPPPVAALASEDVEPTPRRRRWGLWIALALLLALAAAAVALFWPDIESRVLGASSPEETITVDAAPSPRPAPATAPVVPDSVLRAGEAEVVTAPADAGSAAVGTDGDPAATDVAPGDAGTAPSATPSRAASRARSRDDEGPVPQTGIGRAPAPGVALLPPRVTGLSAPDVRALTALDVAINPDADAWTLVVLSTRSREEAEALRQRYRQAGYRAAVLTSRSGNFRVAVGQFATRDDALRLLDRLPPQAPADTWALDLRTL